ncbi:MAG: hypothetical protein GY861_06570 [bacterium]|nr:hypothetical protein [bacterium]
MANSRLPIRGPLLRICISLIILMFSDNLQASRNELGSPFIRNYTPEEFGAAPQVFVIIQDKRGVMYFGNNSSIVEFDGSYWKTTKVPNTPFIYSFAVDSSGTLYLGGFKEFRFRKIEEDGGLKYVSLVEILNEEDRDFTAVHFVHATINGCTFKLLIKYIDIMTDELALLMLIQKRTVLL